MKHVVILNGMGGVGKDTFVEKASQYADVKHTSSVDMVKVHAEHLGWDGKKDEAGRRFLSDIKDAMTRYNDGPFNYVMDLIKQFAVVYDPLSWSKRNKHKNRYDTSILFIDVREPNEIEKIVEAFKSKGYRGCDIRTALVVRDSAEEVKGNHAGTGVYDYSYDYIIDNNYDLMVLDDSANAFVKYLDENFCPVCEG